MSKREIFTGPAQMKEITGTSKIIYLVNFRPISNANKTILFLDYCNLKNKYLMMFLMFFFF